MAGKNTHVEITDDLDDLDDILDDFTPSHPPGPAPARPAPGPAPPTASTRANGPSSSTERSTSGQLPPSRPAPPPPPPGLAGAGEDDILAQLMRAMADTGNGIPEGGDVPLTAEEQKELERLTAMFARLGPDGEGELGALLDRMGGEEDVEADEDPQTVEQTQKELEKLLSEVNLEEDGLDPDDLIRQFQAAAGAVGAAGQLAEGQDDLSLGANGASAKGGKEKGKGKEVEGKPKADEPPPSSTTALVTESIVASSPGDSTSTTVTSIETSTTATTPVPAPTPPPHPTPTASPQPRIGRPLPPSYTPPPPPKPAPKPTFNNTNSFPFGPLPPMPMPMPSTRPPAGPPPPPRTQSFQSALDATLDRLHSSAEGASASSSSSADPLGLGMGAGVDDKEIEALLAGLGGAGGLGGMGGMGGGMGAGRSGQGRGAGGAGGAGEGDVGRMLDGLLKTLMSKSVLEEPLAELADRYPQYLSTHPSLPASEKQAYERQLAAVRELLAVFRAEGYKDGAPEWSVRVVEGINKLQELGNPPKEVMGDDIPDLGALGLGGLGGLGGGEGCVVV